MQTGGVWKVVPVSDSSKLAGLNRVAEEVDAIKSSVIVWRRT